MAYIADASLGLPKKKPLAVKKVTPLAPSPLGSGATLAPGIPTPSVSIPLGSSFIPTAQPKGLADYLHEMTSDPNYGSAEDAYTNALTMGRRSLLADPFKQALTSYGYDITNNLDQLPQGVADYARQYLDPAAQDAANANPFSTRAQIEKSFNATLKDIPYKLAARGMGGSGAAATAATALKDWRGLQDKQAMDQFANALSGNVNNWLNFQTNQTNTWEQAKASIADRLAQMAGYSAQLDAGGNEVPTAVSPVPGYTPPPTNNYAPMVGPSLPGIGPVTGLGPNYAGGPTQLYQPVQTGSQLSYEAKLSPAAQAALRRARGGR